MVLEQLKVTNFRNIRAADLFFDPRINLVFGENGAGKSSLLEAIYCLGMARSFRTRRHVLLVNSESDQFSLFAEFKAANGNNGGASTKIGISKTKFGKSTIRFNGSALQRAADLAEALPVQIINGHSFSLLEGGPVERRGFLDWLVFHVKHEFKDIWAVAIRCIKQRNALLKNRNTTISDLRIWDDQLISATEKIYRLRVETLSLFKPYFNSLFSAGGPQFQTGINGGSILIRHLPGWKELGPDSAATYADQLYQSFERDRKAGFTTVGFHRADLKIELNGQSAVDVLSRGQQKILIAALLIAQIMALSGITNKKSLLLVDDLPSELDKSNLARFCGWVSQLSDAQVFITGVNIDSFVNECWSQEERCKSKKMFHVKHGQITEEPCSWSNS